MNFENLPDFTEVTTEKIFTEKFIKLDTILDKPIIVIDFCERTFKEKQGKTVNKIHILIMVDDERRVISTASAVLEKQVKTAKAMPFKAKIVKINNFYTFAGV